MSHCNTVLNQILKIVPRHEFEALAIQHHSGRSFRRASRWSQFVSLTIAQLTGRHSLRDIVDNVSAGNFQGSCTFSYAANNTSFCGFSATAPQGRQFRVWPDHRLGFAALAS